MSLLAGNKKAGFNYEILESFEAGIALSGWEVKSAKAGHVSLAESFVSLKGGEAWLLNTYIKLWKGSIYTDQKIETRERKLLLNRAEIDKLQKGVSVKGNTIIVLDMHTSHNRVKLKIALARGKKLFDKRETIKKREQDRELRRDLKNMR